MPFRSSMTLEYAVAGGHRGNESLFSRPPEKTLLRNLYFRNAIPHYDDALKILGESVSHAELHDGDAVLYAATSPCELREGNVVVLPADKCNEDVSFDENWKCLRVVEGLSDGGLLKISSMVGEEKKSLEICARDVIGKVVFSFTP
jgi:hypothetical protein